MKHKSLLRRLIYSVAAFVLSVCCLSACGETASDGTLKIGFNPILDLAPEIMAGVKSDHTDFAIDDVTLDFYYGGNVPSPYSGYNGLTIGVALYFCNEEAYKAVKFNTPYEDYQNIEGFHFVKFIPEEEFNSDEYSVQFHRLRDRTYQHSETLTVPSDVFIEDDDCFCLAFVAFHIIEDEPNQVRNFEKECLTIKYEFIDERTVRLS